MTKKIPSYRIYILCFLSFISSQLFAQSDLETKAPTLQIGLDGFSFTKGSLDAQLIMEIVAEKQREIKVKSVQNVYLTKVHGAGGAVYTFTDNIVRELLFEPDANVRTKKILENTVNLVFVSNFLNFYLNTLPKGSQERRDFARLAKLYNKELDQDELEYKERLSVSDLSVRKRTHNYFADENATKLIAILFDISSKAVREDPKLKRLGLMQIAYSESYQYLNLFDKLIREKTSMNVFVHQNDAVTIGSLSNETVEMAEAVLSSMQKTLRTYTRHVGTVSYLLGQKSFRFDEGTVVNTVKSDSMDRSNERIALDLSVLKDSVLNLIKTLESGLDKSSGALRMQSSGFAVLEAKDTLLKKEINQLVRMYFYLDKAENAMTNQGNTSLILPDILYTFYNEFIPILKRQAYRNSSYVEVISLYYELCELMYQRLLQENEILQRFNDEVPAFLMLVSQVYQFDRFSTLAQYMSFVDDLATYFPDDNIRNALGSIISFVKDYTLIEKAEDDREIITFNIESYLYRLQSIKPFKMKRVEFLFTVGVNSAVFNNTLSLAEGVSTKNLSFIGEKIGVKYKMYDFNFRMARNPGETYRANAWYSPFWNTHNYVKVSPPREPAISNIHLLAYGSGMLYNLVNTKTEREFNMPLIGVGVGITFYNGLDLNLTYGVPIIPDAPISASNSFWNMGVDVQFMEYISRLQTKRKNQRIQKRLAEASRN